MSSPQSSKRALDSDVTDPVDAKKIRSVGEAAATAAKSDPIIEVKEVPESQNASKEASAVKTDAEKSTDTVESAEAGESEEKTDVEEVKTEPEKEHGLVENGQNLTDSNNPADQGTQKKEESKPKATFGGTSFNFSMKKKPAEEDPSTSKDNTPVPPVFGATSSFGSATSFGNKSIMDSLKGKPNVFDSLPSNSEEKGEPVSSGFGSNSKFGNAFQDSLKKKSFLDDSKEENDEEETKSSSPAPQQYKQVDLVPVQEIKTGEEDEESIFSVRAKIFELDLTNMSEGWKERGVGPLHLNESIKDPNQVRLVMRSQGLLRVVLNMRITGETVLMKGLEASLSPGKFLRINSVSEKGTPIQYLLKFGNETTRNELYDKVEELKSKIKGQSDEK